ADLGGLRTARRRLASIQKGISRASWPTNTLGSRSCAGAHAPFSKFIQVAAEACVSIGVPQTNPSRGAIGLKTGSSLKGVGKSEFGGGLAIAQGGSRLA